MSTPRLEHWPHLLEQAIDAARAKPFEWGVHDCALFVADCVLAMSGTDPASELRGKYTTAAEASTVLQGFGGLAGIPLAKDYVEYENLRLVQAGDIVYMTYRDVEAFGICLGTQAVFLANEGVTFWPMRLVNRAWKV